jgi:SAM-dependent MidA family methyltransferase
MIPPERLDRWMARRVAAYYAARDPFADFTTAPEITQAFGECLGAWAAAAWMQMGSPGRVTLAEAGPGRGTLMADLLRATGEVAPRFRAALRVHLVETSARLRAVQAARLSGAGPVFHESLGTLPDGPLILLANEWLDALPIRQFIRRGGAWRERFVAAVPGGRVATDAQAGRDADAPGRHRPDPTGAAPGPPTADTHTPPAAHLVEAPPDPAPPLPPDAPEGAITELCEPARAAVSALAARFARAPGVALFLDYGPAESGFGDSLQAMRAGRAADPFGPEPADLTAHVDFAALAAEARAAAHGPLPQGLFLQRIGLPTRAAMLAAADGPRGARHLAAAARLIAPEAMGRLFKALALASPGLTPPGFEPAP